MFTRIHASFSPLALLALIGLLLGGLAGSSPARAQAAPQKPDAPVPSTKEMQDLLTDLDDLDVLHVIQPLKLTPEQMDKLVTTITNASTDYDKKVTDMRGTLLLKMADEIRSTRKKALTGAVIPSTFDDRVKGIQKDYAVKRKEFDNQNILRVSTECKTILTAEQFGVCVKLEKDAYKLLGKYNDKASDALYFNAYASDVFINNPRMTILLKEMKAAQATK